VGYGGLVAIAWLRYGHAAPPPADAADALLDRFMPAYDIVERHRVPVLGAVTQPWLADVVFRPLPPAEFSAFNEPGFVKIAWTLRAGPVGEARSAAERQARRLPS
jgi:hypothetical protein